MTPRHAEQLPAALGAAGLLTACANGTGPASRRPPGRVKQALGETTLSGTPWSASATPTGSSMVYGDVGSGRTLLSFGP